MKLFKKTIFSIFGMALLATGFVACSSDDNTKGEAVTNESNALKSLSASDETYLIIDYKTYIHDDGFYHRYVKDVFDYTFKVSELNYKIEEHNSNFILTNNNDHSEKIEILNLSEDGKGNFTFDVQARDILIENISLQGIRSLENNSSSTRTTYGGWGPVVRKIIEITAPIVAEYIISEKPQPQKDPNLVACTEAMNALNCKDGKDPYMDYDAGSWYQSTKCSVGCK